MIVKVSGTVQIAVIDDGRVVEVPIPAHLLPFRGGQLATLYYDHKYGAPAYPPAHITARDL